MSEPAGRVHLTTLGCRLNEAELQQWARGFARRGLALAEEPSGADLVVINTCAVTTAAARKSRQAVRKVHRAAPGAKLVVSGCYASLEPEEAAGLLGVDGVVDSVVDNRDKDALVERALKILSLPSAPAAHAEPDEAGLFGRGRHRAFVKVQDGCRHKCTYCIVTVARGEERSRPLAHLVEEVRRLTEAGVREVVLTGVHVGGYGTDLGLDLAALVERLLSDTDVERLRLASVEPWDLPPDFGRLFAGGRLLPHLHLPIQSGSDSVLKRMGRRCTRESFRRLLDELRSLAPELNVTTDLIVGFPGETDAEHAETLAFLDEVELGDLHLFPFSPRAGTRAASLPERVPEPVKRARLEELFERGRRLQERFLRAHVGRRAAVLFEAPSARETGGPGYTPTYARVRVPEPVPPGTVAEVDLVDVEPSGSRLIGRLRSSADRGP